MTVLLALACAVVGLGAGAFLNGLIEGVPPDEEWRGVRLPARRGVVLVATASLFGAAAWRFGASVDLPAFCVFLGAVLVLALIDLEHFLLPSRIIYPTLAAELVLLTAAAAADHRWHALERAWIGGVVAFVAFFVVHFIYPAGMAWGDLRFAGLIGAVLGWLGYGYLELGLFLSFLSAAVVGVMLIAVRRASAKTPIPFGVFLALGATVAVFWGQHLAVLPARS